MRLYDIVVLLTPDLSDEEAVKVSAEHRKLLTDGGAELVKDEPWGRRKLAYPIARKREAYYHHFQVTALPATVAEVERKLRLSADVLGHRGVRADGERKRDARTADRLGGRAARRPPRPAAPPPTEAPAAERSEP